jgi:hypothetical protein
MASITANTKHKVAGATAPAPALKKKTAVKAPAIGMGRAPKKGPAARRGSVAPVLKPSSLVSLAAIEKLKALDKEGRKNRIIALCREAMGVHELKDRSTPHAASTTRDRSCAAADVAVAARELGVAFVLKECNVMDEMQRMLFPEGIAEIFKDEDETAGGLKASHSAVSLVSLGDTTVTSVTTAGSIGTDSKRGKTTPANAREGSLLLIRAFCEILGKACEPFVVGAFLAAALDECGSTSSTVREAAEDTSTALVRLANPWAFPCLICPLLLKSLKSDEWRVKANAMDRIAQCTLTAPAQVCHLLPTLIPAITGQVWDTKAQVTKAASATLLAVCQTNNNKDIEPAIPAIVNAICKPSDTNKAVEKLMGTTFIVSVDASTLSILCPVLARSLKEKLAIHKRAACVVISNMSKLVNSPEDVAPFGPLLIPELKKVATNVQFEEIRDEALRALATLTKALGDSYNESDVENAKKMAQEAANVKAEQKRIQDAHDASQKKEEEIRKKEEAEKRKYKEAMDAQRELNKIAEENARLAKEEELMEKDKAMRSTKADGKCQGCGLKKCKKTCLFFPG